MSVSLCVSLCVYVCVDTQTATFLQSCGVADLITSCYSSKIQVMADTFIKAGSYKVTHRQTDRHTDTETDRQTDTDTSDG